MKQLLLTLLAGLAGLSGAVAASKPNIMFLLADDLTSQAISAYQHPLKLLETPHMDRLAREGMK